MERMKSDLSPAVKAAVLKMQRSELTEYYIYQKIAARTKSEENKKVLLRIASEEKAHSEIWKGYTEEDVKPSKVKIFFYSMVSRILGFTFAVKLMENGEDNAQTAYDQIALEIPEADKISEDEEVHEQALLGMLDEEKLRYVGSMVLGLNDALVELTGTLAGLTFALQDTTLIALSGLITGISATFSMASSEYLSARADGQEDALKSCIYTGLAYLVTVALLVTPYLIFDAAHYAYALGTMIVIVIAIIAGFNYYISVAKGLKFKKRFLEMATISLGVAALSFVVGLVVKQLLGVDV